MTVGDINLAVRRKRRQSMPSEATITRLMEENQISDLTRCGSSDALCSIIGRGRPATQAVQRALELSRHPMLGGPRDGATKSLPQTRPGGNPDPRDPAPVTTVVQSIIGGLSARPHRAE